MTTPSTDELAAVTSRSPGTVLLVGEVHGSWDLLCDPSPTPGYSVQWEASLGEAGSYHQTTVSDEEPSRSSWIRR